MMKSKPKQTPPENDSTEKTNDDSVKHAPESGEPREMERGAASDESSGSPRKAKPDQRSSPKPGSES